MTKLTLAALAGATLILATPAYAARGGGADTATATAGSGQGETKAGSCHHQRCDGGSASARRKSCRMRKGWFAEGVDAIIR